MKKLRYDRKLCFEVEKVLIASHPKADYIHVSWNGKEGLVADVEEDGSQIDVSAEMVSYVNSKLLAAD